jgi:hypothetical protein
MSRGSGSTGWASPIAGPGDTKPAPHRYERHAAGADFLSKLGVDLSAARARRRVFCRPCVDWTERRPHIGGAVGAALASRRFELKWIERVRDSRALTITPVGRRGLMETFALSDAAPYRHPVGLPRIIFHYQNQSHSPQAPRRVTAKLTAAGSARGGCPNWGRGVRPHHSSRSGRPPSLPRRCSHRPPRPAPPRRRRNAPSCRRRRRTVPAASTTCAAPAARCARAAA